ncbi:hypothetical protein CHS0354_015177 [Potamilus streckersoni]|uniref:G-protein coupled receptors family 1 profile domain-containing protein n=1 Tax=Potamilus streckersoni TaxID=2493646 RepID=A0AAE0SD30_9BIVA|nr:hypothetical protein CHS0354_015177 [Potamilus streckersoni]
MSVPENKSDWMIDIAVSNASQQYLKFAMTDYIFTLYTLYLSGTMTVGIPGNSIILAIYYKHKPVSNVDYYILSISVLDLVCLVGTVPIYIVIQTRILDVLNVNTLCKALNFTGQIVTFAQSFLLCAMATERFIKVCRPRSTFSLDRRGKYIVLSIILSTIFISVPNLLFSWITNRRHCVPITNPPSIASAFFLLTVSLFIAMFGIVSLSYASVAKTLFQSVKKTTRNSITSRMKMQRNKIVPQPCQTDLKPTTSSSFERMTNETPLSVQTNDTSMYINARNPSSYLLVAGDATRLGKSPSHKDDANSGIVKDNENYGKDLATQGKRAVTTERLSGIFVKDLIQVKSSDKQREKLVPDSFENMSLPQRKRLLRTTKISFLITITFIISWLPVWIYTVLVYSNSFRDPYGAFFLKQSYLINTFMNPILCLAFNRNFRNKAKGLFFKHQPTITP